MDTGALEDGNRECEAAMDKIVDAYNEFVDEEIEVATAAYKPTGQVGARRARFMKNYQNDILVPAYEKHAAKLTEIVDGEQKQTSSRKRKRVLDLKLAMFQAVVKCGEPAKKKKIQSKEFSPEVK